MLVAGNHLAGFVVFLLELADGVFLGGYLVPEAGDVALEDLVVLMGSSELDAGSFNGRVRGGELFFKPCVLPSSSQNLSLQESDLVGAAGNFFLQCLLLPQELVVGGR